MLKKLTYILYKILHFFDSILKKIFNRSFLVHLKDLIEKDSYAIKLINDKKIVFFTPNAISKWRINSLFQKEPETIDWIDSFDQSKKIIFWDIGANIGIYSVYAATKFNNIEVVSFEPSTSNLRILSRNISINNLENKIKINQFPLIDKENQYLTMNEGEFVEGWSMNTFGQNTDFKGETFLARNKYKIFGTSIDYILKNKFLEIPNHIKIDVDGIEHLILKGGTNFLRNDAIKSISIELNENYKYQYKEVLNILQNSNFILKHKKRASEFYNLEKFDKIYNFVFEKKNY